jgi:DNA polymerase-3 subunit chi
LDVENPNEADVLVITNGQLVNMSSSSFKRCLDLFDGQDHEQVLAAQERLRSYKNLGYVCTWWVQSLDGKWAQIEHN